MATMSSLITVANMDDGYVRVKMAESGRTHS